MNVHKSQLTQVFTNRKYQFGRVALLRDRSFRTRRSASLPFAFVAFVNNWDL